MSQQPPPPPYGGPSGPYGQPPGQPPPSGMSNKAKFWLGVVLALPVLFVGGFMVGLGPAVTAGDSGTNDVGFVLGLIIFVMELIGLVALIVIDRTRWIGLGILAGLATLFILAAGACIALIVGLSNSYN